MSDNIKVVVKVRPLISREIEDKLYYQWRVHNNTLYQIDQTGRDCGAVFTFDKVYDKDTKTNDVYNDIAKPIVEAATAGVNGTIFAYGQTSSGKTHTMTGTDGSPGIIPLSVLNLFEIIKGIPDRDFLVRVSFIEIYNETLTDLLDTEKKVKIQETLQGVKLHATEKLTTSPEEVLDIMIQGKSNRQTASTNMNDESSRSHSIFQITIESREHIEGEQEVGSVHVSQLNLVDLAGSERAGQTGATGLRFKEGTHINKSLSTLALVIKQLSEDQNKYVNYRDSKLTRILQNSLGGNAKTSIICAVTPAAVEETISTLQFANRAKAIKNTPAVNAVATSSSMIQNLTKQLSSLKTELENKKNVEEDNCNLQKRIAYLQKLIINGFHQRSSSDLITGARKKLHQPRRITISTLHPIQEDSAPSVIPKFCTPSLKYNPVLLPGCSDFVPINQAGSLLTVQEETPRLVTPPLMDKRVNFNNEVINLDSDDDSPPDPACSPYHKCFESSKTPPCVLRKHAKIAEKNLKEIVELTEREKQYSPNVVELMEKIEEKSLALAKLEDDIVALNAVCKEKDSLIDNLKSRIGSVEGEIQSLSTNKTDLEAMCKDYQTKLTDSEVSYETLLKKSKNRERELLSLLEEQTNKNTSNMNGSIGLLSIDQLSKTKSMSTKSINTDDNFTVTQNNEKLSELQAQLTLKDQTILELEAMVTAHKHKVDSLEIINKELQEMVNNYKQNVVLAQNENVTLTTKVKELAHVIENQKLEIKSITADVDSYNSVIQELQIKLADHVTKKITFNDEEINSMIEQEKMLIANNENMKNLLQALKLALDSKNNELQNLKLVLDSDTNKRKDEINTLHDKIVNLQESLKVKEKIVSELEEDKVKFISIEKELLSQIKLIEVDLNNSEKIKSELLLKLESLRKENENLKSIQNKLKEESKECENKLNSENELLCQKIKALEDDIKTKDLCIEKQNNNDIQAQENLAIAKNSLVKLQEIIVLLTGNIHEVPEILDDFVMAFKFLSEKLIMLENVVKGHIEEKEELRTLLHEHETEVSNLKRILDAAHETLEKVAIDFSGFESTDDQNISAHDSFNLKLRKLIHKITTIYDNLQQQLKDRESQMDLIQSDLRIKELELENRYIDLQKLTKTINESNENIRKKDDLLYKIQSRIQIAASEINMNLSNDGINGNDNDGVLDSIDQLINYTKNKGLENNTKIDNIDVILLEAKKEIDELKQENIKLIQDIEQFEVEKNALCKEIETAHFIKKGLESDLKHSDTVLNELKEDLQFKANEIQILEDKAKDWKQQFIEVDALLKEQISELENENANLRDELDQHRSEHSLYRSYHQENFKENQDSNIELISPPSLLTICCNRIVEAIPIDTNECISASSSNTQFCNSERQMNCRCSELSEDINTLNNDNIKLKEIIVKLENDNQFLINEREEAHKEINLLLELSGELQKKLMKHRTNLSTLTATTYAENKSLENQLKFLQHYHNLFYKACQKDIPEFKRQLQDLMILLKSECTTQQQNESFRRYSLPNALENSMIQTSFKYESMLDGDLLMLDTNITLTTCDNTFTGNDQTCFDVTQTSSEIGCQTTNCNELPAAELKTKHKLLESLDSLRNENNKLRDLVEEHKRRRANSVSLVNTQTSPFTSPNKIQLSCEKCQQNEKLSEENNTLEQKLKQLQNEKIELETKYNNLTLEIPATDALIVKLKNLQKDHHTKAIEVDKLTKALSKKDDELRSLQEENDSLSNQIMENIDEVDCLRSEVESLKKNNTELASKVSVLEMGKENIEEKTSVCSECVLKNETISLLQVKLANESHKTLSRSYSDSDSSSRYNKICTLQNELHAGREDCNELKNEVTNIRNHLERSNISIDQAMELDDSMGDAQPLTYDKNCDNDTPLNKSNMPDIPEERPVDLYSLDKIDCVNYCIHKTGIDRESFNCDMKIIDVMKMLYDNFVTKHSNEVENLTNKLRDFEDSKNSLQTTINILNENQAKIVKESEDKDMYLQTLVKVVSQIKQDLVFLSDTTKESDMLEVINCFKDNFCTVIDKQFGLTSVQLFKTILKRIKDKYDLEISKVSNENQTLQDKIQNMFEELKSAQNQFDVLKDQLSENENDKNLLMKQKEKLLEISNAVTLNIIKNENELKLLIRNVYQKLVERNIINPEAMDLNLPSCEAIPILFDFILNKQCGLTLSEEYNNLKHELQELKKELEDKNKILHSLKEEYEKISGVHNVTRIALKEKENEMKNQEVLHEALKDVYEKKLEENEANLIIIGKLGDEVKLLKDNIVRKDTAIQALETQLHNEKQNKHKDDERTILELTESVQRLNDDIEKLKSANKIILQEKETACLELEKASNIIKQNKQDMEKMQSDILILKESVNENASVTQNLTLEAKTLADQNSTLKEQIQQKIKECSRLEMNIKTHQKTAEIQSKMIIRLQKEKSEADKSNSENINKLTEMTQKLRDVQQECEKNKAYVEEIKSLKQTRQTLEERITELEDELRTKSRASAEASAETSRSRRQSLYDSMRAFSDSGEDQKKIEAVFKSRKCEELFMDVDDTSSRSTPIRLNKGRDSLSSKRDQSEEGVGGGAGEGVARAARRRRQSTHDALRSVAALETSRRNSEDKNNDSAGSDTNSEVAKLRKELASCQEELEDLKEKYKDLDEECETCAEYLRERDEQCRRLKKEKKDLENTLVEIKQQMMNSIPHNDVKRDSVDIAVNTDEDWANLHSVVVDRMSYDAEVEKNKKLMKIVEELRCKKQELRNTMGRMQKAIDKYSVKDKELEAARAQLSELQREVEAVRARCRELDEECDTCALYLKERDEQCRRLRDDKHALEMKIKEYQESNLCTSIRKKRRQTLHDQNRRPDTDCADVATETSDDFLSYQVEKDENSKKAEEKNVEELRRLKMVVERLSQQKAMLEQQVVAVSAAAPLYVATGSAIVQNQQFTDVMKENQKLKKINAKLVKICKKSKSMNRENEDPADDN